MKRQILFKILGMDTDSDESSIQTTTAIRNYNLRFTTTDEQSSMAVITNEKGPEEILELKGTPLGYATVKNYIVIFSKDSSKDYITIYKNNEEIEWYAQYEGSFNFSMKYPIEALVSYEREDIIKVYWVDGLNPFRVLRIPTESEKKSATTDYFNVVKDIQFLYNSDRAVLIKRLPYGGTFPSGTIQYVFTYFNKYGSESNIFKVSPIYYLSNNNKGTAADTNTSCSFQITLSRIDTGWDYVRVYSIIRTTANSTAVCKKVTDLCVKDLIKTVDGKVEYTPLSYIDNGLYGESIDSTRLLYVGGETIIPETITQKDGTLFLGNYKIQRPELTKELKEVLQSNCEASKDAFFNTSTTITREKQESSLEPSTTETVKVIRKAVSLLQKDEATNSSYQYSSQLGSSSDKITTFKSKETYRIGIQLQDKTGRWSEPIFLFDAYNNTTPLKLAQTVNEEGNIQLTPTQTPVKVIDPDIKINSSSEEIEEVEGLEVATVQQEDSQSVIQIAPVDTYEWFEWNKEVGGFNGGSGEGGSSNSDYSSVTAEAILANKAAALTYGYLQLNLKDWKYNDKTLLEVFTDMGYRRVRPLVVFPSYGEREVLFQGIANPTIKKVDPDNNNKLDYKLASWFFRPIASSTSSISEEGEGFIDPEFDDKGNPLYSYGYKNHYSITNIGVYPVFEDGAKIPYYDYNNLYNNAQAEFQYKTNDEFYIDWSTITIDSPDLKFNEQLNIDDLEDAKLRIVGYIDISGNTPSYDITIDGNVETPKVLLHDGKNSSVPFGNDSMIDYSFYKGPISSNKGAQFINAPLWIDGFSDRDASAGEDDDGRKDYRKKFAQFYIYPWQRNGSLNNCSSIQCANMEGYRPSVLKKKIIANARFAFDTVYCEDKISSTTDDTGATELKIDIPAYINCDITDIKSFLGDSTLQVTRFKDGTIYRNSIDVVLPASGYASFAAAGQLDEWAYKDFIEKRDYSTTLYNDDGTLKAIFTKKDQVLTYNWGTKVYNPSDKVTSFRVYAPYKYQKDTEDQKENNYSLAMPEEECTEYVLSAKSLKTQFFVNRLQRYYDCIHDKYYNWGDHTEEDKDGDNDNDYHKCNDPIPMQFKTGSNCVVNLKEPLLPQSVIIKEEDVPDDKIKYLNRIATTSLGRWLPLVEVYKEVENKFGGTSESALMNNNWLIAGPAVNIGNTVDLFWDNGDTYFQRYDCLKTMPYSETAVNSIVEIMSFFCETRINIDGRYDVNRGIDDYTIVDNTNFNLLNEVYTQSDNYFQYSIGDQDSSDLNKYENQIIWSMTKQPAEPIDYWTNITLLNNLDLDGNRGPIRALKEFNSNILAFQDKGIALIKYNQDALIQPENGLPIEIANSGKVTGSQYLFTNMGCMNKWAIADIQEGIFFIDSLNRKLMLISKDGIKDIGQQSKFESWIKENCSSTEKWNTQWYNSSAPILAYDKSTEEILIINKNEAVAFSIGLLQFTSFYSYENSPFIINNMHRSIIVKDNKLWDLRKGEYNMFFGEFKPYSTEIVLNDEQTFNLLKLFSEIEVRDNKLISDNDYSFDTIEASNSYQKTALQPLIFIKNRPSNLKTKLRTWRFFIPRASEVLSHRTLDRMKDHYLKVKLSHTKKTTSFTKVHSIIGNYYI